MTKRILIAGGGFGGFHAARTLERLSVVRNTRVTLVNDANFMLYTPLLPGAAGATLDPRHVVVALRPQLPHTELLVANVTGADLQQHTLTLRRLDGHPLQLAYDHLLIALGSVSRALPIPGLAEHGIGLKSLADATALRNQVLRCLDIAESLDDDTLRGEYLTFVFVGAGYAGLEGLAELQDFAAYAIRLYPRCRAQGMRWALVEARERILAEVPDSLARFAARELRGRGIEILTNTTLTALTQRCATLSDTQQIPTRTLVWTAGVKPSPVVSSLGVPLDLNGRIVVDRALRVSAHPNLWALGDCAAVPDPSKPDSACPPTAQHAMRQGRLAAHNIAAVMSNEPVRPFRFRTAGVVAELGHNKAVAITLGVRWRGLPAWLIARTYHLLMMPGVGRRLRLLIDWNVALLFGRELSAPERLGRPTPLSEADEAHPVDEARVLSVS